MNCLPVIECVRVGGQAIVGGDGAGRSDEEPPGEAGEAGRRREEDRDAPAGVRRQRLAETQARAEHVSDVSPPQTGREADDGAGWREGPLGGERRGEGRGERGGRGGEGGEESRTCLWRQPASNGPRSWRRRWLTRRSAVRRASRWGEGGEGREGRGGRGEHVAEGRVQGQRRPAYIPCPRSVYYQLPYLLWTPLCHIVVWLVHALLSFQCVTTHSMWCISSIKLLPSTARQFDLQEQSPPPILLATSVALLPLHLSTLPLLAVSPPGRPPRSRPRRPSRSRSATWSATCSWRRRASRTTVRSPAATGSSWWRTGRSTARSSTCPSPRGSRSSACSQTRSRFASGTPTGCRATSSRRRTRSWWRAPAAGRSWSTHRNRSVAPRRHSSEIRGNSRCNCHCAFVHFVVVKL